MAFRRNSMKLDSGRWLGTVATVEAVREPTAALTADGAALEEGGVPVVGGFAATAATANPPAKPIKPLNIFDFMVPSQSTRPALSTRNFPGEHRDSSGHSNLNQRQ